MPKLTGLEFLLVGIDNNLTFHGTLGEPLLLGVAQGVQLDEHRFGARDQCVDREVFELVVRRSMFDRQRRMEAAAI